MIYYIQVEVFADMSQKPYIAQGLLLQTGSPSFYRSIINIKIYIILVPYLCVLVCNIVPYL